MNGNILNPRLSEIYVQKLEASDELHRSADAEKDTDRRRCLRDQAGVREYEATWIAHCIALYGDLHLSAAISLLDEPSNRAAQGRICGGENPWLRGLQLLRASSERVAA